jgi:hypothetical protein
VIAVEKFQYCTHEIIPESEVGKTIFITEMIGISNNETENLESIKLLLTDNEQLNTCYQFILDNLLKISSNFSNIDKKNCILLKLNDGVRFVWPYFEVLMRRFSSLFFITHS